MYNKWKKLIRNSVIIFFAVFLVFQIYLFFMNHQGVYAEKNLSIDVEAPNITIVYDNNKNRKGISTDWGFSCLVRENDKNILFDVGNNGYILLENMRKMNINPQDIDAVVLSHSDNDHINGLKKLLQINNNLDVYLLDCFPKDYKHMITLAGANVIEINEKTAISKRLSIINSGRDTIKEQALTLTTDNGVILITGCSHYGISEMITHSKDIFDKDVLLAMGGFHLKGEDKNEVDNIINGIKDMGVKYIGPVHCTGTKVIKHFKKIYKDRFIDMGAGKIILVDNLK